MPMSGCSNCSLSPMCGPLTTSRCSPLVSHLPRKSRESPGLGSGPASEPLASFRSMGSGPAPTTLPSMDQTITTRTSGFVDKATLPWFPRASRVPARFRSLPTSGTPSRGATSARRSTPSRVRGPTRSTGPSTNSSITIRSTHATSSTTLPIKRQAIR